MLTQIIKRPNVELLCQSIKTMAMDLSRNYNEGVKKCCISDEMDRWKDEEEGSNIGSECEETGVVKTVKLRKPVGMVTGVKLVKLNKVY